MRDRPVLRLLRGRLRTRDARTLIERLRADVMPASAGFDGLLSTAVGTTDEGDGIGLVAASIWRDAAALDLAGAGDRPTSAMASLADLVAFATPREYVIVAGELPETGPITDAVLGLVTLTARLEDEAAVRGLIARQEAALRADGLVRALLVGRRETGMGIELAALGVWPDRDALAAFLGERPEGPGLDPHMTELTTGVDFGIFDVVDPAGAGLPVGVAAVLVLDDRRHIVDASSGLQRLMGVPPESLLGRRLDDLVAPADGELVAAAWRSSMAGGEGTAVIPMRRPDGSSIAIRHRYRPHVPTPGLHAVLLERPGAEGRHDVEAAIRHALGDWEATPAAARHRRLRERGRPRLVTLPSDDRLFARFAQVALDALGVPSMRRLQLHLRGFYPHSIVHRRSLAGEGAETWYVFRDGRVRSAAVAGGWWHAPGVVSVSVRGDGTIAELDAPAGLMAEATEADLVGHDVRSFAIPGGADDFALLLSLVFELGTVESTMRVLTPTGDPLDLAFHAEVADGLARVAVAELPAEEPRDEWFAPLCLPASDHAFIAHVEDLCARLAPRDPLEVAAELQVRLRVVHPRASVRPLGRLTGFGAGTEALLVYRDGEPDDADRWRTGPDTALLRIENDRYAEVNDAAARLLGTSREALLGTPVGRPIKMDGDEGLVLRDILHRTGRLHTTGHLLLDKGGTVEIEFDARVVGTQPTTLEVALRAVPPAPLAADPEAPASNVPEPEVVAPPG